MRKKLLVLFLLFWPFLVAGAGADNLSGVTLTATSQDYGLRGWGLAGDIVGDWGDMGMSPLGVRLEHIPMLALCGGALWVTMNNDLALYQNIQSIRNGAGGNDGLMNGWTELGDGYVDVAGCGLLYVLGGNRDKRTAELSLEGLADTGVAVLVLKNVFGATRPSQLSGKRDWFNDGEAQYDAGFPSGHTAAAFCLGTVLGRAYHLEWLTYPLATGVAFSRVYLSEHWPSDTLAGALLGYWIGDMVWQKRGGTLRQGLSLGVSLREETPVLVLSGDFSI